MKRPCPLRAEYRRIDLKLLLLSASAADVTLAAWEAQLRREGVPFDTIVVGGAGALADDVLADYGAGHARYQGVVLTTGNAADPGALPAADAAALDRFERTFGIRRLSDNTFPNAAHGLAAPDASTTLDGTTATLTATGRLAFGDLAGPVPIGGAAGETFGHRARPLPGADFETLLAGADGCALLGVHTRADGREEMVMTVGSNQFQIHNQLLRHGMLAWVTRGIYLGVRRHYLELHVDDVLIGDDAWDPAAKATSFDPAERIRMDAADVARAVEWSRANGLRLDLVYNGLNTDPDEVLDAFKAEAAAFGWINHTFSHPNLDCATRAFIAGEIVAGAAFARAHGLPIDPAELVTGEHSGLANTRPGNPGTIDPPALDGPPQALAGAGSLPAGGYDYGITARSSHGETTASVARVATTSPGAVAVGWPAICHAVGYEVYRKPAATAGGWARVGSVAHPSPCCTDAGPVPVAFTDTGGPTAAGAPPAGSTALLDPYPENPSFAGALADAGITVVGADASKDYPQGAAGTVFTVDPDQPIRARAIPRHPTNVYYNAATRTQQLDEFNWIQGGTPVTWEDYVAGEVAAMFTHVTGNDPTPHFFHEANLARTGDPEGGVLYQVVDALLARYRSCFAASAPLRQLGPTAIADELERQAAWHADVAAGRVSAWLCDGRVHVATTATVEVPLTGTTVGSSYGGRRSGVTTVTADAGAVFEPADPGAVAPPVVSGAPVPGATLTASPGRWSGTGPIGHAYQWQRGAQAGGWEAIAGATGATYRVAEADRGAHLRVVVAAGNWISSVGQATSRPTAAVGGSCVP